MTCIFCEKRTAPPNQLIAKGGRDMHIGCLVSAYDTQATELAQARAEHLSQSEMLAALIAKYNHAMSIIRAQADALDAARKALQDVLNGFETGAFQRTRPRRSDSDPYHPVLLAARAALDALAPDSAPAAAHRDIDALRTELRYTVETCDSLMMALQECRQEPMSEPEHLTTARALLDAHRDGAE